MTDKEANDFPNNPGDVRKTYDPKGLISDPLAQRTEWTPARGGGVNFCTHRVILINPERMEFRPSAVIKCLYLIFILFGLSMIIFIPLSIFLRGDPGFIKDSIINILAGMVFTGIGGIIFYFEASPIVFDRRSCHFWKGWGNPDKMLNPETLKHFTRLGRIHALQLISEYCTCRRKSKKPYYSYELNLVLEDGSRINVVDHGDVEKLREDARTLSEFLGKPVWDGSEKSSK